MALTLLFVQKWIAMPRERLLELQARWPERYPALLESAARGRELGRFDLLFAFPERTYAQPVVGSFLNTFDRLFLHEQCAPIECPLPFSGGWLVFVGYELAAEIEPSLALPPSPDPIMAMAMRVPAALIYEHETGQLHLIAESNRAELIDAMTTDLTTVALSIPAPPLRREYGSRPLSPTDGGEGWCEGSIREDPPEQFLEGVRRVKEHIRAGDVYQVNLSRGWSIDLPLSEDGPSITAADLYRSLRTSNPAPFAASLVTPDWAVLSSSPERLFSIRDGEIATRPIAGTWRRSRQPGADAAEKAGLAAHPKERAEHVMLVDLERNDLGRICVAGSVHVNEFMALESYEHVHHIVSNVRGRLRKGITPGAVFRAVFPGGTITGCPKVRCMQIIAELEGTGRGAYTGSLGYLNRDGTGDFNILIRTMTYRPSSRRAYFRAGAGIVADSDPERELAETRAKAEGLLRAFRQGS